jgi:hypothetical protein
LQTKRSGGLGQGGRRNSAAADGGLAHTNPLVLR